MYRRQKEQTSYSQKFFLITMANVSETFTFKLTFTAVVNNYERMAITVLASTLCFFI